VKRLKLLIIIFCLALSIPLSYLVLRTYQSLQHEEISQLRYFAEAMFREMEKELEGLVLREEKRDIDQYRYNYIPSDQVPGFEGISRSPLSKIPDKPYILGYLQNNPDGTFETPLVENQDAVPEDRSNLFSMLRQTNEIFNLKRTSEAESPAVEQQKAPDEERTDKQAGFADRYLSFSRSKRQKDTLGQEQKRIEQVPAKKALNISKRVRSKPVDENRDMMLSEKAEFYREDLLGRSPAQEDDRKSSPEKELHSNDLRVEVDPMQSVFIDDERVLLFRRIMIHNQIYRQGLVIKIDGLLSHLADNYFSSQPMSRFSQLRLKVMDREREVRFIQTGAFSKRPGYSLNRGFPRPFAFLQAELACDRIPLSEGRQTLNIMLTALAVTMLIGLFAIYKSARAVVDLADRRTRFVSSVTHEVKTPLTNIRMYAEMLEQKMASDPEKEQSYFRILGSESARLSRLIDNVLEFSKLENRQRSFDMREGNLADVIKETVEIMQEKLRQEGFALNVEEVDIPGFRYDREVMIQILINLIENSVKFGKALPRKEITISVRPEGKWIRIRVSDTGPGIPRHALKKVFDDFYRVEGPLTRSTSGTGIGLSLVKKFVTAMGGSISARNNDGPGCTITISLIGHQ